MTVEQYSEPRYFADAEAWVPDQRPRDFSEDGVSAAHARYVRIAADATHTYLENRRNGAPTLPPEEFPEVVTAYTEWQELNKGELRSRFG